MYDDGSQPQYTRLRASVLAYAHINLISMLSRFRPEEVTRVATDSVYTKKTALPKLEGVEAYVAPKACVCGGEWCVSCLTGQIYLLPTVAPAQWRDKGEWLYMPMEHAAYLSKPEHKRQQKNLTRSTAPRHDDPLTRHQLSYLNGSGGSGKTTRVIELFQQRDHSSSHRLIPWPKRCGPEGSKPRPITASSAGMVRLSGHRKEWASSTSPHDHLGRDLHCSPAHAEDLP